MARTEKGKTPWYKQKIVVICIGVAVICLMASGVLLFRQYKDNQALKDQMATLKEEIETSESIPTSEESEVDKAQPSDETVKETLETTAAENTTAKIQNKEKTSTDSYQELFDKNADMCAWIKVENTVIDYPVMQTMQDENYYLEKDFNGKANKNGCLIMDTDSDVKTSGTNLIIHGHNMKSGEMFGSLTKYEDQSYYEEHRNITLTTRDEERHYVVMAVFRSQVFKKTDECFKYYKFFQANTQEEFDDFYNNVCELSKYDTGVTAEFGDHFLTLSTCAYHVDNGRFVVVAKQVD